MRQSPSPDIVDPKGGTRQREQLERSERNAKRTQPENYQQEEANSKVVSTGQASADDVGSIHGLDNDPSEQSRKKR